MEVLSFSFEKMYCIIKYYDYQKFLTQDYSESYLMSSRTNLAENNEALINPNCYLQILIEYIYEFTKIDPNGLFLTHQRERINILFAVTIDLCDDSGRLLKLKSFKPNSYATDLLKFEQIYYVVLCEGI